MGRGLALGLNLPPAQKHLSADAEREPHLPGRSERKGAAQGG